MVQQIRKYWGGLTLVVWSVLCAVVMASLALLGMTTRARALMPLWGKGALHCLGTRWAVHGHERLPATDIIAAVSHHSLLDTFIYPAILHPDTCYVAKSELARLPLFARVFRRLGNVFVERGGGRQTLEKLTHHMASLPPGHSIFIHPEGTRGPEGQTRPLKPGIAHLACESTKVVVPIVCVGGAALWPKGTSLPNPGHIEIYIGEPIPTQDWRIDNIDRHLQEVRSALDTLFTSHPPSDIPRTERAGMPHSTPSRLAMTQDQSGAQRRQGNHD